MKKKRSKSCFWTHRRSGRRLSDRH